MTVDWWQLRHAYGRATDTPWHLHALEFGDAEARVAALDHLDIAVLHQDFPYTATAPAVRAVTALLADGRAHPDTVEPLLRFLGSAARAATWVGGNRYFAEVLPDLADGTAAAYPIVRALLESCPPDRVLFHAEQLVALAQQTNLADRREEVAVLIQALADRDPGPKAPWVSCLGRVGVNLRGLLADPDPAVRLRAALAHEDDPRSQELVLAALAEPAPAGVYQWEIVAAAIRGAPHFDAIAAAACEVVRRDSWAGFDIGWGALVRFAFAEPYGEGRPLTDAQRALLRALVANDQLWDPTNGSCGLVFTQAGLPRSRSACRQLAA
jgi:hypothetical protein